MTQICQRRCPQCGRYIQKEQPEEPWRCDCGWSTDIEHKRRVYRGAPFNAVKHQHEATDDE